MLLCLVFPTSALRYHEKNWFVEFDICELFLYRRYLDDIFCMFKNEIDAEILF